jgi:hypothetical protein
MRYHLGKRRQRHYKRKALVCLAVLLLLFGLYKLLHLKQHSTIHNTGAVSQTIKASSTPQIHIDKPLFGVDLPTGWTETSPTTRVNIPNYTFKSAEQNYQLLQVYLDTIPAGVAVNRAVSVTPEGAGMSHDDVSDNCTQYTQAVIGQTSATGMATAKWENLLFTCDTGNYERDVIGTVSPAGLNEVDLTGPTVGTHKVFLVYTDNNVNANYVTLYGILDSFKLK